MAPTRDDAAPDVLEALQRLEESLWSAETRYDLELMDKVFASDFYEIGRSGKVHSRADFFVASGAEYSFDAVLPLPNFRVRHSIFGSKTKVLRRSVEPTANSKLCCRLERRGNKDCSKEQPPSDESRSIK